MILRTLISHIRSQPPCPAGTSLAWNVHHLIALTRLRHRAIQWIFCTQLVFCTSACIRSENLLGRDQKWGRLLGLGPGGQQMQSHGRESGIMENMANSCHEAMPMGDYAGAPQCDEPCCPWLRKLGRSITRDIWAVLPQLPGHDCLQICVQWKSYDFTVSWMSTISHVVSSLLN